MPMLIYFVSGDWQLYVGVMYLLSATTEYKLGSTIEL